MGLFDDIFKRDEINQLKKALAEKNADILKLESEITQLSNDQNSIGEELVKLKNLVIDKESSISSLKNSRDASQTERAKLSDNFETFKRTSADQIAQATNRINELQETLAKLKP
jgi:chromosome segregation ATPase